MRSQAPAPVNGIRSMSTSFARSHGSSSLIAEGAGPSRHLAQPDPSIPLRPVGAERDLVLRRQESLQSDGPGIQLSANLVQLRVSCAPRGTM